MAPLRFADRPTFERLVACAALLLVGSCTRAATAIVVVVDSDLGVPSELASVHADLGGAGCSNASCTHDFALSGAGAVGLPFSFTVTPHGDGGPLALTLRGRDGSGADRVVRTVSSSFVSGRTLLLRVFLERACADATCSDPETCIAGACASAAVDPATLADVIPGTELDGGSVRADAGSDSGEDSAMDAGDDGGTDAAVDAAIDAGRDASRDTSPDTLAPDAGDTGTPPRSCADLRAGSPPGAYMIDPDGSGVVPPFLDYCETSADGGGWTLIAKVDPGTTTLAFGASTWTAVSPTAGFGTADLTVGDALLPSYWVLPVRELRIVMAPAATPSATRTLVTALTPAATLTMRSAMEAGLNARLDATLAQWVTLVGASPTPGTPVCSVSGVPAVLPSTTPAVRVRIGYVWDDAVGCPMPGFWAGVGADGTSCRPVASSAGGGRLCGTGAVRHDYPLAAWVFGR